MNGLESPFNSPFGFQHPFSKYKISTKAPKVFPRKGTRSEQLPAFHQG